MAQPEMPKLSYLRVCVVLRCSDTCRRFCGTRSTFRLKGSAISDLPSITEVPLKTAETAFHSFAIGLAEFELKSLPTQGRA